MTTTLMTGSASGIGAATREALIAAGHIVIGNNVKIQAQSGIGHNIKDNEVLQGSPAFSFRDYYKSYVHFKKLPELVKTVNTIEKTLKS